MADKLFVIVYSGTFDFDWACIAAGSISEAKKLAFRDYTDCQHLIDIFERGDSSFQELALKATQAVNDARGICQNSQ